MDKEKMHGAILADLDDLWEYAKSYNIVVPRTQVFSVEGEKADEKHDFIVRIEDEALRARLEDISQMEKIKRGNYVRKELLPAMWEWADSPRAEEGADLDINKLEVYNAVISFMAYPRNHGLMGLREVHLKTLRDLAPAIVSKSAAMTGNL